mmetsp:Transcript_27120/g.38829  ORF Transcript_27120/g.38829 Transcript_27120/m.38829 type:complete len:193 (-) Transcript_27120:125-703(-)
MYYFSIIAFLHSLLAKRNWIIASILFFLSLLHSSIYSTGSRQMSMMHSMMLSLWHKRSQHRFLYGNCNSTPHDRYFSFNLYRCRVNACRCGNPDAGALHRLFDSSRNSAFRFLHPSSCQCYLLLYTASIKIAISTFLQFDDINFCDTAYSTTRMLAPFSLLELNPNLRCCGYRRSLTALSKTKILAQLHNIC